jgi:hypothetical protein
MDRVVIQSSRIIGNQSVAVEHLDAALQQNF